MGPQRLQRGLLAVGPVDRQKLIPVADIAPDTFDLSLHGASLRRAAGGVPLASGAVVAVEWDRQASGIRYRLESPRPITLRTPSGQSVRVEGVQTMVLPAPQGASATRRLSPEK